MSHKEGQGVYIDADIIDEELEVLFQKVFDKFVCVFHNAKFDISMLEINAVYRFLVIS